MKLPPPLEEWAKRFLGDEKKRMNTLLALGVAGMLLIAASEWLPAGESKTQPKSAETASAATSQTTAYETELEQRLTEILIKTEGVGAVQVMVTLAAEPVTVYAEDTQTGETGSTAQHVLLDSSSQPALVETVESPEVQGVAVICEGGGNITVVAHITEIVHVLTGAGESHISIAKMSDTK